MNRMTPECERLFIPSGATAPGCIEYSLSRSETAQRNSGSLRSRILSIPLIKTHKIDQTFIDMRKKAPENWAHFLNNHLPLFFHICKKLELNAKEIMIVLPSRIPSYIIKAVEYFDLTYIATDRKILGTEIVFSATPWICLRSARHEWAYETSHPSTLQDQPKGKMPCRRVFISRKKSRALENERSVQEWLNNRGFVKVYPEDYDVPTQIALFREAEVIVAIHGAALAPLLYAKGGNLKHVIEILPCGHMTLVYHTICCQLGISWAGVRGKIKPSYLRYAYSPSGPFTKFSSDSFEISLESLELAFDHAGLE